MSVATLRAKQTERAILTVEAVGGILLLVGEASLDRDHSAVGTVLLWLGRQLEDAGMVLAGGGE